MNRPLAWLLGLLLTACSPTGEQVRERSSWNDDWKFALSDSVQDYSSPDSDDSTWRILSLPHDWSIEGDFSLDNPSTTPCRRSEISYFLRNLPKVFA